MKSTRQEWVKLFPGKETTQTCPPRRLIAGNQLRLCKFDTGTSPSVQPRFIVSTDLLDRSNRKSRMTLVHYLYRTFKSYISRDPTMHNPTYSENT